MKSRKEYKGTKYDHLIGSCCECGEPLMFSDSISRQMVNWDEKRVMVDWHRKCYEKTILWPDPEDVRILSTGQF